MKNELTCFLFVGHLQVTEVNTLGGLLCNFPVLKERDIRMSIFWCTVIVLLCLLLPAGWLIVRNELVYHAQMAILKNPNRPIRESLEEYDSLVDGSNGMFSKFWRWPIPVLIMIIRRGTAPERLKRKEPLRSPELLDSEVSSPWSK